MPTYFFKGSGSTIARCETLSSLTPLTDGDATFTYSHVTQELTVVSMPTVTQVDFTYTIESATDSTVKKTRQYTIISLVCPLQDPDWIDPEYSFSVKASDAGCGTADNCPVQEINLRDLSIGANCPYSTSVLTLAGNQY